MLNFCLFSHQPPTRHAMRPSANAMKMHSGQFGHDTHSSCRLK